MASIYTISPTVPFAEALAEYALAEAGGDPFALSEMRILLPTRRACRTLRETFLEASGGKPLLLPRIQPIGDLEEEPAWLLSDETVLPAVSPMERWLLLTKLVQRYHASEFGEASLQHAAALALELAKTLEELIREQADSKDLETIVPTSLAAHWESVLTFLAIVTRHYPDILKERGRMDPSERRNRLLESAASAWRASKTQAKVIAAGTTGSIPATAQLLSAILSLPNGMVVLPGLDCAMDEESWAALEESHPQFGMKQLLARLHLDRSAVKPFPSNVKPDPARETLISEVMRPASTTEAWAHRAGTLSTDSIYCLEAASRREEAALIGLLLRETLETPGKTAALVTRDRKLARHVACFMRRYGVMIDDSAGVPLSATPPGAFLLLVSRLAASSLAPVDLLAALKHPLADPFFRQPARRLDIAMLRGIRPESGLKGLRAAIRARGEKELLPLLERIEGALGAWLKAFEHPRLPLREMVRLHLEAAEQLAGKDQLWAGAQGRLAAETITEFATAAEALGQELHPQAYHELFALLLRQAHFRPAYSDHPRLRILSPMEARMSGADRVILSGLNEGNWPEESPPDPWMSDGMRRAMNLPTTEFRIGQSAHDFAQLLAAREVFLTRAGRVEGTPQVASRWWQRLQALAGKKLAHDLPWQAWAELLDRPEHEISAAQPMPKPPVSARPRALSVTRIEALMQNPYAVYAQKILHLRPLDPLDADPSAADFGSMIHEVYERLILGPGKSDVDAFMRAAETVMQERRIPEPVRIFWRPKCHAIASWVEAAEEGLEAEIFPESQGAWAFDAPAGAFTLQAKADRLEILKDGSVRLIDYKTGALPQPRDIELGIKSQLPLEGVIASEGGFAVTGGARTVSGLAHWKLGVGRDGCDILPIKDHEARMQEAREGVQTVVRAYDHPDTAYIAIPTVEDAHREGDYDHLSRMKEWREK